MTRAVDALRAARLILVCGSGGVGKTTTSAALGVALAGEGARVLVITVDPARRLAQALGLNEIGTERVRVPLDVDGQMSIAMLDTKAGWDELVRRHAKDESVVRRILANPLYHNITARFVNSHDYIAMETLHDLGVGGEFDVVVVDTPPSRNALALLDAPTRMREFFGGRLLRWLTLPYRSKTFTLASRPFLNIADRLLGAQFLGDIAEFFSLFQSMEAGFVRRATEVERTMRSADTACIVVTTADPAAGEEALYLVRELRDRAMNPHLVVVNKTMPVGDAAPDIGVLTGVAAALAAAGAGDTDEVATTLSAMAETVGRLTPLARREQSVVEALSRERVRLVTVPLSVVPSSSSLHSRESDPRSAGGVAAIVSALTAQ